MGPYWASRPKDFFWSETRSVGRLGLSEFRNGTGRNKNPTGSGPSVRLIAIDKLWFRSELRGLRTTREVLGLPEFVTLDPSLSVSLILQRCSRSELSVSEIFRKPLVFYAHVNLIWIRFAFSFMSSNEAMSAVAHHRLSLMFQHRLGIWMSWMRENAFLWGSYWRVCQAAP